MSECVELTLGADLQILHHVQSESKECSVLTGHCALNSVPAREKKPSLRLKVLLFVYISKLC